MYYFIKTIKFKNVIFTPFVSIIRKKKKLFIRKSGKKWEKVGKRCTFELKFLLRNDTTSRRI